MSTTTAHFKRTRVLVASAHELERVVLEADLLRAGYVVLLAENVDEAVSYINEGGVDCLITDIGLAGGGGFSLMRRVGGLDSGIAAVGLSPRPVDAEVRSIGQTCGLHVFVEAPLSVGELRAAVERVLARVHLTQRRDTGHEFSGGLGAWSVADLVRYMAFYGRTGSLSLSRPGGHGTVYFREGSPVTATLEGLTGEKAVQALIEWNEGLFTLKLEAPDGPEGPAVRPPRNIHRSAEDVLLNGLLRSTDSSREVVALPGLDVPHRMDRQLARDLGFEEALVTRLGDALDGERTLHEALHAAQVEGAERLSMIVKMLRSDVIRPVTGVSMPPIEIAPIPPPESPRALDLEIQQTAAAASEVHRHGPTLSRKLSLKPKRVGDDRPPDDFAEFDTYQERRRAAKQRSLIGWLVAAAVIIGLVVGYFVFREDDKQVETRFIDEAGQTDSSD